MKLPRETYDAVARRAECLVDRETMEAALDRLAEAITARLAETDPLILSVMTGGMIAAGVLVPRLDFQLRLDYIHVSRYRDQTRGGALQWTHRPSDLIRGETVLVIDDILDEGVTMDTVVSACREDGAAAVLSAVLIEKERPHCCAVDFVGMRVPDRYLFGYGLDYKGYFRNVPGIFAIADGDR